MFKLEIFDARGKLIKIGDFVRYTGTGTVGQVCNLKTENDNEWVEMENPKLWYSHELIEVLDLKHIKDKNSKDKNLDIDEIKNLQDDLENVELDSNVAEGGG